MEIMKFEDARAKNLWLEVRKGVDDLKREIYDWEREFYLENERRKKIREMLSRFNPDTDVIASKAQLDITNELKAFARMANKIEQIQTVQSDVSTKVTEVHTRLTNNLGKKEIPLTKKQRVELELEEKIEAAHLRVRANGYQAR